MSARLTDPALPELGAAELRRFSRHLILPEFGLEAQRRLKETDEPVDVMVDIGVFARPEGGKEADEKVLYLQKHRITQAETTLELVVDELPFEAGIDPYNKLIDRNSGDNRKKAVLM